MLCALIRGYMDDLGLPVHGAATERALFGSLPTVWLQDKVYPLSPASFSWAAAITHGSWFVVPWLMGILVSWKRPQRIGSFFLWWMALHFIVNPLFGLFPLQPPWLADDNVIRVVSLHLGSGIPDNNPLAAMPSLHVALPLLMSAWFFRERWRMPAWAMLAYATLIAAEVTFAGEHYIIDVFGAIAVVAAIWLATLIDYRRVVSRFVASPPARSAPRIGSDAARPGLASRPSAIFAVTLALITLVTIKVSLTLFAGVEPIADTTFTGDNLDPPTTSGR
jgi:hypothetical protein